MHFDLVLALANCQGRYQYLSQCNSSNTSFDTTLCHLTMNTQHFLYVMILWGIWSEVAFILLIHFRNCEIWQRVRTAIFKVLIIKLMSGKFPRNNLLSVYFETMNTFLLLLRLTDRTCATQN